MQFVCSSYRFFITGAIAIVFNYNHPSSNPTVATSCHTKDTRDHSTSLQTLLRPFPQRLPATTETIVHSGRPTSLPISFFPRPRVDRAIIHNPTPSPPAARRFSNVPYVHSVQEVQLEITDNLVLLFWVTKMFPLLRNRRNETSRRRDNPGPKLRMSNR